jgi:hypothetical protein
MVVSTQTHKGVWVNTSDWVSFMLSNSNGLKMVDNVHKCFFYHQYKKEDARLFGELYSYLKSTSMQ